MKTKLLSIITTIALSINAIAQTAILPTSWSFTTTSLPTGWSAVDPIPAYYSASGNTPPAYKFDATGDQIIINFAGSPGNLTYYLAGNSFSGGTFLVEESVNGTSWSTLHSHTSPPASTYTLFADIPNSASHYIRFNYSNKVTGNIGLDDVTISAGSTSSCTADITTGLVAKYDFSGNANDVSGNNLNGTVSGATLTTDRFGNANCAYSFDGTTNQIVLPSSELANATALSLSGWFNANSSQTGFSDIFQIDVNNPNTSNPANDIFLRYNNGLANFSGDLGIQGTVATIGATPPSTTTWHHFALTYNGSIAVLYINGVLVNQGNVSGTFQSFSEPLYVGNWNGVEGFNGKVDDIRIYNRALTLCDIDSLYNLPNCAGVTSSISQSNSTTFCQGDSVILTATNASSYLWSNGATTQSITVKTAGSDSVSITTSNGCVSTSTPTVITVHSLPTVALSSFSPVCSDSSSFTVTGGTPIGGGYSGIGVSSNMFNPSIVGIGTFPITYTYTDGNNCSDSATQNLTVNSCSGSSQCFTSPDGTDGSGWSYKDYVIPTGYRLDSVFMDATRSGYPPSNYDFVLESCQGITTYNNSIGTYPFDYNTENNSLYNIWIDLTSFNYTSVGMVRVSLPTNASAVWNQVCFATSPTITTGINFNQVENNISFYPNPTSGIILISGVKNGTIIVYNSLGQIIKKIKNINTIDLSAYNCGLYFIQVINEKGVLIKTSRIVRE